MIEIKVDTKEINDLTRRIARKGADASPAMKEIAAIMFSAVQENFEQEGRPKWPELKPSTIKRREKLGTWPGHILRSGRQGGLASSITPSHDARSATVGTNKKYAATHQFGASKGAFGKTARGTPIPWGNIPPRPFLKLTDKDEADIIEQLKKFLDSL